MDFLSKTLPQIMLERAEKYGSKPLFHSLTPQDSWQIVTWRDFGEKVRQVASSLIARGITQEDGVCIFTYNVPEYFFLDFGSQYVGCKNSPIYMSNTAEQAFYILKHLGARLVLVDSEERLKKVLEVAPKLPKLDWILTTFETQATTEGTEILSFAEFLKGGTAQSRQKSEEVYKNLTPHHIYTVMYTSGTTGEPKGVMLSHKNTAFVIHTSQELQQVQIKSSWRLLSYLPLAHVAQRVGDYTMMAHGLEIYFSSDITAFREMVSRVRPHVLVAVPRILEKIYQAIMSTADSLPPRKKKIFKRAEQVARAHYRAVISGGKIPWKLSFLHWLYNLLVYRKIQAKLGGSVELILSGGALIPQYIGELFSGMNMPVTVIYGLTETSAPITYMTRKTARYDTVAKPMPGTEVKIAHDGEILFRGPNLFCGYFKQEEATREAIDPQGWFHTGDLGAFDDDGYLLFKGRKKEIIVTSQGQNIAPAPIESALKESPLLSQALVVGDEKKYLVALLTPGEMETLPWAEKEGIQADNLAELASHPRVLEEVEKQVQKVNDSLPSYQTIKSWKLLKRDFSQEKDELTPTLKVRRKIIEKNFAREIEELYTPHG